MLKKQYVFDQTLVLPGEIKKMIKKLKASLVDNDHSFLRSLITLSVVNILIIYWIGMQLPGNPAHLPIIISVGPAVKEVVVAAVKQHVVFSKNERLLVNVPPPAPFISQPIAVAPQESPGGGVLKRIIFASDRECRFYQLYMIDSNGENLERLTHSTSFDRDPHVAYDGKQVAFSSNRLGNYQIFTIDLTTKEIVQLTEGRQDKTNPIWSPDNKKILYTIHKETSSYLGMMNADGTGQQIITKPGGHHYGYGFSPDGSQVSYEAINRDCHEIFLFDLKTRESSPIVDYGGLTDVGDPVFSPTNNIMVFTSDSIKHHLRQLYIYDDDVKHYYRITHDQQDKDDPVFSPDGKMIAYIAKWENAWNIYVMNADGTNQRNITKSHYDHVVPSWR